MIPSIPDQQAMLQNGAQPQAATSGTQPQESDIKIDVHLERLTIGDLEVFDKFSRNETTLTEMIDFLQRVIDGDVRSMPMTSLASIMEAVTTGLSEAKNPGN